MKDSRIKLFTGRENIGQGQVRRGGIVTRRGIFSGRKKHAGLYNASRSRGGSTRFGRGTAQVHQVRNRQNRDRGSRENRDRGSRWDRGTTR